MTKEKPRVRVRMLRPGAGPAWTAGVGEMVELEEATAQALIDAGAAEPWVEEGAATGETRSPGEPPVLPPAAAEETATATAAERAVAGRKRGK